MYNFFSLPSSKRTRGHHIAFYCKRHTFTQIRYKATTKLGRGKSCFFQFSAGKSKSSLLDRHKEMKKQCLVLFSLSKKGYYNDRSVLLVLSSEDSNNEFLYKDYWPTRWTLFSNSGLTETEKLHSYGPLVISHIKPEQSWIKPYSGKRIWPLSFQSSSH